MSHNCQSVGRPEDHRVVCSNPDTPEDGTLPGVHYAIFEEGQIENKLSELLDGGDWSAYAERGYNLVMEHHTWSVRAAQLRDLIAREFGI